MRRIFVFRHPRARGQALLEFALVLPLILMMVIGIMMLFTEYQKELVYTKASQTLVEWIARTGSYDDAKRIAIKEHLGANLVGSSDTYLHVKVTAKTVPTYPNSIGDGAPSLGHRRGTSSDDGLREARRHWLERHDKPSSTCRPDQPWPSRSGAAAHSESPPPPLPTIDWTMVPASHSVFYTLWDPRRGNP
jgi:uncharacterized protein (UPF0333 family)